MRVNKLRKICIYTLAIFLIFSSIVVFDYSNNEKIEKQLKINKNNTKPLDQEGQNYRLVTSADNVQVPVPKGYVASNITGENYVIPEYTYDNETKTKVHDGGFVIYQLTDSELATDPNGTNVIINDTNKDTAQSTRNQYIWIPVSNIEDITRTKKQNNGIMQFGQGYTFSNTSITKETNTGTSYYREPRLVEQYDKTKYYLQRYSNIDKRESYLNNQQEDFIEMIKSINKYKGFYIGRYETGDDYTHSSSKKCFTNPRVVRYNSNLGYVTWYDSYKNLKRLSGKTGEYVETGMIYDTMWNYTLKWLNETDTRSYEEIRTDSGTWGNYYNNSFKYKTSVNGTESTKNANSPKMTSTGGITEITYNGETYSDSPTSSNNIFDIASNVWEWTRSRYSADGRRVRGGNYYNGSTTYPAYSISSNYPYDSNGNYGVRSMLLIR